MPRHAAQRWLAGLPAGEMCEVVGQKRDALTAALEHGRHAAISGPLLALLRLGQRRHRGVPEAVEAARQAFYAAVTDDRAQEAEAEWQRAFQGAARIVMQDGFLPAEPACRCVLQRLRFLLGQPALLSRGVAANNERKVLRYLLTQAERTGSLLVKESQRQIAEHIDVHQPTVVKVIRRLVAAGWLTPVPSRLAGVPNQYLLKEPSAVGTSSESLAAEPLKTLSTKSSLPAEFLGMEPDETPRRVDLCG